VVTAALLYTQYWGLYLAGSFGLWLCWQLWRGPADRKSSARWMIGGVVLGVIAFIPWVPVFLFQARYTGTPWAKPPNFAAAINAVTGFTDNQATNLTIGSNQGRLLALCYFILAGLALFGVARDRIHIDLDIRTRRPTRGMAFVVGVTLLAAITGGILTGSAFSDRYASVIFVPLLILVAYGALTLYDPYVRAGMVAVLAVSGLAVCVENIWTERTQAPAVAAVIEAHARPGDVVAFCPDQLGPAVYRLMADGQSDVTGRNGRFDMVTYPRGIGPAYVDWVTYKVTAERSDPLAFARRLEAMAGHTHHIWLVSAAGYEGFGEKCQTLAGALLTAPGYGGHQWVNSNPNEYYEPMGLTEFAPPEAAPARAG
jgi:hypothetical protein